MCFFLFLLLWKPNIVFVGISSFGKSPKHLHTKVHIVFWYFGFPRSRKPKLQRVFLIFLHVRSNQNIEIQKTLFFGFPRSGNKQNTGFLVFTKEYQKHIDKLKKTKTVAKPTLLLPGLFFWFWSLGLLICGSSRPVLWLNHIGVAEALLETNILLKWAQINICRIHIRVGFGYSKKQGNTINSQSQRRWVDRRDLGSLRDF